MQLQPNDVEMKPPGIVILRKFVRFVLEKWKDIGFSYNHSRTMVSQVSIADDSQSEVASLPVAASAAPSPADHSRSSRISQTHRGECIPNATHSVRMRHIHMFRNRRNNVFHLCSFRRTDSMLRSSRLPVIPDSNELHI